VFFRRDQAGHEVDLLRVAGDGVHAIEMKSGMTISDDAFNGLRFLAPSAKKQLIRKTFFYGGNDVFTQDGVRVATWRDDWLAHLR
jgi:hypothetical protein